MLFPVTLFHCLSLSEDRKGEESLMIKWELAGGKYDAWSFEDKRS